jgi:glycosyltransferase involved in cell wall biosynthesis
MAAGCVPVVINRGGQREIVEHGVSGFLWDTLEELKDYTTALARDQRMRERMSESARERARYFSYEQFSARLLALLRPPPARPGRNQQTGE